MGVLGGGADVCEGLRFCGGEGGGLLLIGMSKLKWLSW